MRLFRWNYILPRLALLLVVFFVSEHGIGWLTGWTLENQGSASLGARVDVASSKASLLNTQLTLGGIQVANPDAPMTNLFSAEQLDLDFDTTAALRKKAVIEQGTLRGLRIGSQRETSGALDPTDNDARVATPASAPSWLGSAASAQTDQWLGDLEARLTTDAISGLKSPALAERLQQEWPQRAAWLRESVVTLQERVRTLEADLKPISENPLRGLEVLRRAPGEIADLTAEAARLRDEIARLPQLADADRQRIADAREHDERLIREQLNVDNLDPESVTAYMLGDQLGGPVGKIVSLLRWTRSAMPAGDTAPLTPTRGVDVPFPGSQRLPDLLVKRLDITGSTRIEGRPVEIVGLLTGFTTQPVLHGEPMHIELNTTGGLPLHASATIDRTGPQPRDTIAAQCDVFPLPAMQLGKRGWLNLEAPATTAAASLNLRLDGETLDGDVRLVLNDLAIRPATAQAEQSAFRRSLNASLAESLSRSPRVETTIRLGGELDAPTYAFDSTLGQTVATAMRSAVRSTIESHTGELLADSRRRLDDQLTSLDKTIASVTSSLDEQVREQSGLLDQLSELAAPSPLGGKGILGLLPGGATR